MCSSTTCPDIGFASTNKLREARSISLHCMVASMDLQVYANLSTHNKQELTTRLQSQDILPSNSNASTSGGGRHENQLQTVNEFAMPVPRPSHRNDPGLVSGDVSTKSAPLNTSSGPLLRGEHYLHTGRTPLERLPQSIRGGGI